MTIVSPPTGSVSTSWRMSWDSETGTLLSRPCPILTYWPPPPQMGIMPVWFGNQTESQTVQFDKGYPV